MADIVFGDGRILLLCPAHTFDDFRISLRSVGTCRCLGFPTDDVR